MFDFTTMGITIMIAGTIFMVVIGRHLLPRKDITKEMKSSYPGVTEYYDFQERLAFLQIPDSSDLQGKTLQESRLGAALGLNVVVILRDQETIHAPSPEFILEDGDRLLVEGDLEQLTKFESNSQQILEHEPLPVKNIYSGDIQLAEVTIALNNSLLGMTLRQAAFRHVYKMIVLAIRRNDKIYYTDLEDIVLQEYDALLVKGHHADLMDLQQYEDFLLEQRDAYPEFHLEDHLLMVRVPPDSLLAGSSLIDSRLGDAFGLSVQGIIRDNQTELMPDPEEILQANDILIVKGKQEDLNTIQGLQNLTIDARLQPNLSELESDETSLIEAVLSPHSTLAGKEVREIDFRARYGLTVLAIWRGGRAHRSSLRDMKIRMGDALLLFGPRRNLQIFGAEPDFLVLSEDALPAPRISKAPLAIMIMALVLIPAIFNWLPIAISAVAGVALMILTGVLQMDEAYRYIEWKAVFLIAGMLPLGTALEQSGAAQLISDNLLSLAGNASPLVLLTALFFVASLSSQFMPNPAIAVLLAPIALSAAAQSGLSPYPLMMTVAIASSAAFLSPIGHPANLLVMGPGGYRFSDYFKVGLPLTIVVWVVTMILMPIVWPF
jgi:di/tricarboxylate transporter